MRLLTVMFLMTLAAAASAASAPAPTTNGSPPATTQSLDQSSPKALLRSFFASRGEVDESTIRSILHATNPLEQQIVDASVQIQLANSRLAAAEKSKFGKATTRPTMTAPIVADDASALAALTEKIDRDRAVVTLADDPESAIHFIRIDGKWKLPIGSLVGTIDVNTAKTIGATAKAQIEIIDALTAEVSSGKLTSEDQVRQELTRRFAERLAAAVRSSTQPASPPPSAPLHPRGT
jgi:hypothetical protein